MSKHSTIFYTDLHKKVEEKIRTLINAEADFLSTRSAVSPRATGDVIQEIVAEHFKELLGAACKEYSSVFARRAMADLAFKDEDGRYYIVDVKTHRAEVGFHMPNLTSVERLARFYEDDSNYFCILQVSYTIAGTKVNVGNVHFVPIEFLSWDCLTIGALGWGQIQIVNANHVEIREKYLRKTWMLELCDNLLEFYPREITKIGKRVAYFENLRRFWEKKETI